MWTFGVVLQTNPPASRVIELRPAGRAARLQLTCGRSTRTCCGRSRTSSTARSWPQTRKVMVGPMVTNPATRDWTVTASTLRDAERDVRQPDHLRHRARRLRGARRCTASRRTLATLREAIHVIRELANGRAVEHQGRDAAASVGRRAAGLTCGSPRTARRRWRWPARSATGSSCSSPTPTSRAWTIAAVREAAAAAGTRSGVESQICVAAPGVRRRRPGRTCATSAAGSAAWSATTSPTSSPGTARARSRCPAALTDYIAGRHGLRLQRARAGREHARRVRARRDRRPVLHPRARRAARRAAHRAGATSASTSSPSTCSTTARTRPWRPTASVIPAVNPAAAVWCVRPMVTRSAGCPTFARPGVLVTVGDLVEDVVVLVRRRRPGTRRDNPAVIHRTSGGSAANVAAFASPCGARPVHRLRRGRPGRRALSASWRAAASMCGCSGAGGPGRSSCSSTATASAPCTRTAPPPPSWPTCRPPGCGRRLPARAVVRLRGRACGVRRAAAHRRRGPGGHPRLADASSTGMIGEYGVGRYLDLVDAIRPAVLLRQRARGPAA